MAGQHVARSPLCLTVPGLRGSGPDHWQSRWEAERQDCERVDLGCWDAPIRNVWISRLDQAVSRAPGPVVLVGHGLGCLAIAWWASFLGEAVAGPVLGALLVAPSDVDAPGAHPLLRRFAPCPHGVLPFPSLVIASRNDPYATIGRAREMAGQWLSGFVDIGEAGHINGGSDLGAWDHGQQLLERFIDGVRQGESWEAPPVAPIRTETAGSAAISSWRGT